MTNLDVNIVKSAVLNDVLLAFKRLLDSRTNEWDYEKHVYVLKKELSEEDMCYINELAELSDKLLRK